MPTQTHTVVVNDGTGAQVARGSVAKTANTEIEIGSTIATAADDVLTLALDVSNIVAWWLLSDRDVTLTVNDDGSPDETYELAAGVPKAWHNGMDAANPMVADWTSIKIANASGQTAHVSGAFLVTT